MSAPRKDRSGQRMRADMSTLFAGSVLGLVLGLRFALRLGMRVSSPLLPLVVQAMLPAGALLGSASGLLTTVSGVFSAIASPILGRVGDKHGGRGLVVASSLVLAGAIAIQGRPRLTGCCWWRRSSWGLLGGTLSIISAYIGRSAPEGKAGTAYGLDTLATSLSNAIGPTVGGWLGASYLSFPFYVGSVVTALSGFVVLKLPKDKKQQEVAAAA